MFNYITQAFVYITSDQYFWPSMAFTTMVGIYIGAVLYNGDVEQVRKGVIGIFSYATLLLITISSRVLPRISSTTPIYQPLASLETVVVVTLAYLLGMFIGVKIVKRAHKQAR